MKCDAFFNKTKDWSQRKHRLLGKYLMPFTAKLGSWNQVVYCVDGFAGIGKYGDDKDGSPLIMAQLADAASSWKKPVSLRIINVESNPAHYNELVLHTKPWADRGIVINKQGKFSDLAQDILFEIGIGPAFFFIDPYGPSKVPFSCLLPILERPVRETELMINFDGDGLRRLADRIQKNVTTPKGLKGAETTIALVTTILGTDSWKAKFESGNLNSKERERVLLDVYMRRFAKHEYHVAAYPIRPSKRKSPKYYLIYCTRHIDGVLLMNDFIREEEDRFLGEEKIFRDAVQNQPGQTGWLFSEPDPVEEEQIKRRDHLRTVLLDYLPNHRKTTRGAIKRHFKVEMFGVFHEKDYNATVGDLVIEGVLSTSHGRKRFNDNEPLTYIGF